MSMGMNEEVRILMSDESMHEEGDDEEEGCVDDDDVDEDNNNNNDKKITKTIIHASSQSPNNSPWLWGLSFFLLLFLFLSSHHLTPFPQQQASKEATTTTRTRSLEEEKNEQESQQQHNQVNGSSAYSTFPQQSPSPLVGSHNTTISANTATTSTTTLTSRSRVLTTTQTSASTATLANIPSPSTTTITNEPDISPADSLKEESTSKEADTISLMRGFNGFNRYQHICSPVGLTTELCMTLRYPFPVPQEVPLNGSNMRHADERFFQLTGLVIVDNAKLEPCLGVVATEDEVRGCLDGTATDLAANELSPPFGEGEPSVAVAVFTRRKKGEINFEFFGTRSQEQLRRVGQFFKPGHKLIILGDSNVVVGSIASCTSQLFETCKPSPKFPVELRMYCDSPADPNNPQQRHRRNGFIPFEGKLDHKKVFVTKLGFVSMDFDYKAALMDLLTEMKDPNAKSLETASILVQYPVAHLARENDLLIEKTSNEPTTFEKNVNASAKFIAGLVDFQSTSTQAEFAKIGWKLTHMFAFDGLTQHQPSETGAYKKEISSCREGQSCDAYPAWKSNEYGPLNCIGPVPNGSPYRKFIVEERSAFQNNKFDMRWYGKTWDFTNLFWWQHRAWNGSHGLDCTHYTKNAGGVCMYKYFLQAMIDESVESLESTTTTMSLEEEEEDE